MKTKLSIISIAFLSFTLSSFTVKPVDTLTGVYEGLEDSNYVFTVTTKNGEEKMIFNYLAEEVFENFDLDSEEFIGKNFTITYENEKEVIESDNEKEEEIEYLTITKLVLNE